MKPTFFSALFLAPLLCQAAPQKKCDVHNRSQQCSPAPDPLAGVSITLPLTPSPLLLLVFVNKPANLISQTCVTGSSDCGCFGKCYLNSGLILDCLEVSSTALEQNK